MEDRSNMKVEREFISALNKRGVRYIFGIEGGSWIPYMEEMRKTGIEFVLVANEASAGIMADICFRITGTPGVCYATYGPGATNLTTGVGCAWLDRSAVIAVTSEFGEEMRGKRVQMNIDHHSLFRGMTKATFSLNRYRIDESVSLAFDTALSEVPGPVHIGIPPDNGERSNRPFPVELTENTAAPGEPDQKLIGVFVRMLRHKKKPIIAAGLTSARFKLGDKLKKLADRHRIPVLLTPMAKGLLPHDHACYAGVLFHAMSRELREVYRNADLVIGIGYDPVEFSFEDWAPDVPLINIDTSSADVSADIDLALDITGDVGQILDLITGMDPFQNGWDLEEIGRVKDTLIDPPEKTSECPGPVGVLKTLRKKLPGDGILTCDVGAHTHLIGQIWDVREPGMLLMTNGWSSMGFGVPAAIAAKLFLPGRDVVCVTGDAGFLMMAGEIVTARRLGLNILFVVLADRELSLIRIKQDNKGITNYGIDLYRGDLINEKSFFGVPVITVRKSGDLSAAIEAGLKCKGPLIIEAETDGRGYDGLITGEFK